jgi:serine/threonine protein kinase
MPEKHDAGTPRLATLKYQITSVLATGPSSTVLLIASRDVGGGRFALKVLKPDEESPPPNPADDLNLDEPSPKAKRAREPFDLRVERARAEWEASQKLNHPAILKNHDFRIKKSWFRVARAELLMEAVEGKTLAVLKGMGIEPLVLIFGRMASALAHMHRREVVHGDLRPSQVFLSRTGQVKVRGYGVNHVDPKFKDGIKPSPDYSAPEHLKDKRAGTGTDLYGLGATMYHALTGRAPAGPLGRTEGQKVPMPTALNPQVPAPLNQLVIDCLQTNPHKRPPDVYEVVKTLEAMAKSMSLQESSLSGLSADQE